MSHLSLSLFGGFEAALDGQPVTGFGTDKVRAILAYLAVEADRPHRRTALAAIFWPELPQDRAAQNLRQSLLLLRRALREGDAPADDPDQPFLLLARQEIRFNPLSHYRLDVADFLALLRAAQQHQHLSTTSCSTCIGYLRQAADLYRGDLLAGFGLRGSVPFEEWQLVQQESLHGRAVEALALLADHYERRAEPGQVLEYARRLVALEPWHERAQMQIMAALAQSGQEGAALEQYASYSRILSQEFGMLPSTEAAELSARIRSHQPVSASNEAGTGPVAGGTPDMRAPLPAAREVGARTQHADERRQVTALVCCRQGGNASAGQRDPEELHEQLARCSEQCSPVLERFGGQRQPRQGSECLAYFGYPVAQEDATRRAVAAGLAMVEAARDSDPLRIGIHTGMMVTGPDGLLGSVPDLARDCMRLAGPGAVMITGDTERIVRGWFECQPTGNPDTAELGLLYRVCSERVEQSRLDWLAAARRLAPLAGRGPELEQLVAALDAARQGRGHLITLRGEAGIGKSRLVWELKQRSARQVRWLETACSPYFQNTSLYPVVGLIEQLVGFAPTDDTAAKRDKLAAALAAADCTEPAALWLLSLLLRLPTHAPAPQTITQDQRERMRDASLALVARETQRQPLMLVIEDLHWADPTTLAWISRSLDALAGVRCSALLTWRPDFSPAWLPRPNEVVLELGPLSPEQTAGMVASIVGEATLSDAERDQVVRQTDGVPLYVEELTEALLDPKARPAGASQGGSRLPATLRDSLTARLDHTGGAKETAQWAAVLGRGFSHAVLAAVAPFDERRLHADLSVLLEAGLISVDQVGGRPGYAFRHALIQEAAYAMLLRRTRQEYHGRVAEVVARSFPHISEAQPEVLAHHYSEAGLAAHAADSWMRAGERAMAQGATEEARTFFDRALASTGPEDHWRRWRVLIGLAAVLNLRQERDAQLAVIRALIALAEAQDNDEWRVKAYDLRQSHAARLADYRQGLAAAVASCEAAARTGNPALKLGGLARKVQALCNLGEMQAARGVVEETMALVPLVDDEVAKGYALAQAAMYYGHLGDSSRALKLQLAGVEMMRRTGDRVRAARLLANIGLHYCQLGKYAEAQAAHEEGLAVAEAMGDRNTQTMHRWNLSYVLWCLGDVVGARGYGERALGELRATGQDQYALATCLGHLGLITEDTGDLAAAEAYLSEARGVYVESGATGPQMELQAVEARALLRLGQKAESRKLAEEVWPYLRTQGRAMIDFPARVHLCLADVFAAVPAPGISAREVLEAGYEQTMEGARIIEDPDWRRSFLEQEVSNVALLKRWNACRFSPEPSSP